MLLDALRRGSPDGKLAGIPTRKQRMEAGTPLKHYLRPLIEESIKRKLMQALQMPQLADATSGMVEPPSISPLQNALMSVPQGGGGSTPKPPQERSQPYGA